MEMSYYNSSKQKDYGGMSNINYLVFVCDTIDYLITEELEKKEHTPGWTYRATDYLTNKVVKLNQSYITNFRPRSLYWMYLHPHVCVLKGYFKYEGNMGHPKENLEVRFMSFRFLARAHVLRTEFLKIIMGLVIDYKENELKYKRAWLVFLGCYIKTLCKTIEGKAVRYKVSITHKDVEPGLLVQREDFKVGDTCWYIDTEGNYSIENPGKTYIPIEFDSSDFDAEFKLMCWISHILNYNTRMYSKKTPEEQQNGLSVAYMEFVMSLKYRYKHLVSCVTPTGNLSVKFKNIEPDSPLTEEEIETACQDLEEIIRDCNNKTTELAKANTDETTPPDDFEL